MLIQPETRFLLASCMAELCIALTSMYSEAGNELGTNVSKIPGVAGVDYTAGSLSVGFGCAGDPNLIGPE
eukprot:COSAG02_NODE_23241_length_725_cov_0.988818_1_plen_70_part_00